MTLKAGQVPPPWYHTPLQTVNQHQVESGSGITRWVAQTLTMLPPVLRPSKGLTAGLSDQAYSPCRPGPLLLVYGGYRQPVTPLNVLFELQWLGMCHLGRVPRLTRQRRAKPKLQDTRVGAL